MICLAILTWYQHVMDRQMDKQTSCMVKTEQFDKWIAFSHNYIQELHIGFLHLVSISTTSTQSTCHSGPVSQILSKSDHPRHKKNDVMSIFKMADLAILDFMGPVMGSLKSPCTTSYRSSIETIALNCLVFEKIAFLYFGDKQTNKQTNRQTNRQTDGQHRSTKALSLSREAA